MTSSKTSLVVFGDSLSDNGNLFRLTGLPAAPAWEGRASNGPTYAEQLAALLGENLDDRAYAGADANSNSPGAITIPSTGVKLPINLSDQVSVYLASLAGRSIPSDATILINIGSNDYSGYLEDDPPTSAAAISADVSSVVGAISTAIRDLTQAGAKKIVLFTLPDFAITPTAIALGSAAQKLATALDVANNAALKQLAAISPNVSIVDIFAFSDALAADPAGFGFVAPPTTTWTSQLAANSHQYAADEIAFFDGEHPTYAAHSAFAAYAAAVETSRHVQLLDGSQRFVHAGPGGNFIFAEALDPSNASAHSDYVIDGGYGADTIFAGSGDVTVWGGMGNDLIASGSGNAHLDGGYGSDVLATNSLGDEKLWGGMGSDALIANRGGSNNLIGGWGNDLLILKESDSLVHADGTFSFGHQNVIGGLGQDTLRFVINDQDPTAEADYIAEFKRVEAAFDKSVRGGHVGDFRIDNLRVVGVERLELQIDSASSDPSTPYLITHAIPYSDGTAGHVGSALGSLLTNAGQWGLLTV